MSVRHFTRVFTAEVGESPSRFVERTRLEAARRELERRPTRSTSWQRAAGSAAPRRCAESSSATWAWPPDAYRRRFRTAPADSLTATERTPA